MQEVAMCMFKTRLEHRGADLRYGKPSCQSSRLGGRVNGRCSAGSHFLLHGLAMMTAENISRILPFTLLERLRIA